MEQLYTVGQVSKLKGVSPRMLRYYDKLGILVPRSVDPETGYRRYTLDQMIELDVIRMCIDAGIPLSELATIQAQAPEKAAVNLLTEAQAKLTSRINALERTKLSIDDYLAELGDDRAFPAAGKAGSLPPGVAVALPWELPRFDAKTYLRLMTELEHVCREAELAPFLKRGIAFDVAGKRAWAFIEVASVDGLGEESDVLPFVLPEGRFAGTEIIGASFVEAFDKGFAAAWSLLEITSLQASTPASITLTERWGSAIDQGQCTILLRAHDRGFERK